MSTTIESDYERQIREHANLLNSVHNAKIMAAACKVVRLISKPAMLINTETGEVTIINESQVEIDDLLEKVKSVMLPIIPPPTPKP